MLVKDASPNVGFSLLSLMISRIWRSHGSSQISVGRRAAWKETSHEKCMMRMLLSLRKLSLCMWYITDILPLRGGAGTRTEGHKSPFSCKSLFLIINSNTIPFCDLCVIVSTISLPSLTSSSKLFLKVKRDVICCKDRINPAVWLPLGCRTVLITGTFGEKHSHWQITRIYLYIFVR